MSRPWGARPRKLSRLYRIFNPDRGDDRTRNWPRDGLDPPKERWRYASDVARRSLSPRILTCPAEPLPEVRHGRDRPAVWLQDLAVAVPEVPPDQSAGDNERDAPIKMYLTARDGRVLPEVRGQYPRYRPPP
jgi:hypothetical protein